LGAGAFVEGGALLPGSALDPAGGAQTGVSIRITDTVAG